MNLLTAEEVAAKLKVHVKSVYKNREIPRLEIEGVGIRFLESQVDAWLQSRITRKAKPQKRKAKVGNFMRHSSGGQAAG